jgi:hypothetical protein
MSEQTANRKDAEQDTSERAERLLRLGLAPSLWFAHFLACYITVSLYCQKWAPDDASLGTARLLCLIYTVVALLGIAWRARDSWTRHRFGRASIPHDFDTAADRHRFLGFAEFLLSVLSFVATLYVALPFGFLATCR